MAEINMDMVGRGAAGSLQVIASGRVLPEYYQMAESANKQSAHFNFNYLHADENHPSNIYDRSGHWNFAKRSIPIVFSLIMICRTTIVPGMYLAKINVSIKKILKTTFKIRNLFAEKKRKL